MNLKSKIYSLYRNCRHTWQGILLTDTIKYFLSRDWFRIKLKINNKGSLRINKWVIGHNNTMKIGKDACLNKVVVKIQGSNNHIDIGANTILGEHCRIYMYGNNLELIIGEGCTFNHDDELLVQEENSKIIIGNDCMFSHHINIRTSDAHPIFNLDDNRRSNIAKSVFIGNHVWVGANVIIQKGCRIGDGCVVATYSIVNHKINAAQELQTNTIYAGMPAKAVKSGIYWKRSFN